MGERFGARCWIPWISKNYILCRRPKARNWLAHLKRTSMITQWMIDSQSAGKLVPAAIKVAYSD